MKTTVFEKTFLVGRNAMKIKLNSLKGVERIDMRMYYYDQDTDKLLPTKKGVNFSPDMLPGIIEMLRQFHMLAGNRGD